MTVATLLVELLTEELPPKALPRLGETFATRIAEGLKAKGLAPVDAAFRSFASPRRLAVTVAQVAAEAAAKEVTEKLMPVSVALDAEGKPTPALLKKMEAKGIAAEAVARFERRLDGKAEALFHTAMVPGAKLADVGEPARIEGVRGTWRVDPSYVGAGACTRTVLLSPLDRLVLDRARMAALFDFDYQLEQYKPVERRRFGYWALPVLHGHDLVGKVDCTAEPGEGVLRVDAVHEDPVGGPDGPPWTEEVRAAVHAEIDALATWLGVETLLMPGVRR